MTVYVTLTVALEMSRLTHMPDYTSHIKTFHKMYVDVGMVNREKRPKQEWDDIRFAHIAIPTSFV